MWDVLKQLARRMEKGTPGPHTMKRVVCDFAICILHSCATAFLLLLCLLVD